MSYTALSENGTKKKCSVCREIKPISEFYSNKARSTKTYSSCKKCFRPTLTYPKSADLDFVFQPDELGGEVWSQVIIGDEPYPYLVSNLGRIMFSKTGKVIRPSLDQRGYPQVVIYGKRRVSRRVHRLVALAYVPNPHNKREVNHKDGDKLNTRASNMEWCSSKENTEHAIKMGIRCD